VNDMGDRGKFGQQMILFESVSSVLHERGPMLTSLRTLEGIKDELLVISDHSNTAGYQTNEADVHAVCELADVLRDAIVEYQVCVNLETSQ